jgi:hypothetical protein
MYKVGHPNQNVPAKGVNTSFQFMVQATANVNIQQSRRWKCSRNIYEETTIRLTDSEYQQYVKKGQSEYGMPLKKDIQDEEYVKWMYMLGEHHRSQRD